MIKYFFWMIFLLLTACGSVSSTYYHEGQQCRLNPANGNETGVYVYRPYFFMSGPNLMLTVDGNCVGTLRNGSYLFVPLYPGVHVLGVPDAYNQYINYTFLITSNQIKYIKLAWRADHFAATPGQIGSNTWVFVETPSGRARYQMRKM